MMMPDREKIIESLEKAKTIIENWIPMFEQYNTPFGIDCAIVLLKEQEKLEERLQHAIEAGEEYRKEWEIINTISAADHETANQSRRQIIMCKDCKYGVKCLPDSSKYSCTKAFGEKTAHSYDWFCADGKRRDCSG